MSFPRYRKYRETGVSWIGAVPDHWRVLRVKQLCTKIGSGKTPSGGAEVYEPDGIQFIRSQNVYDEGLRLNDIAYISEKVDHELRETRVQPGDILLNITGASLGRTALVPDDVGPANVNQHVCIIRLANKDARRFTSLSLKSEATKGQIRAALTGAARDGLNFEQVGNIVLAMPPDDEQRAIAAFLDRETTKIDALVDEQKRLIALLKEKRQAVISHAVTKGLDPNAPMKNSGVEWLGQVPAHWDKPCKLSSLAAPTRNSFVNGPFGSDLLTTELVGDGVPVIYIRDLSVSGYRRVSEWHVTQEKSVQVAFCDVLPGDVLVAKVGDPPGLAVMYPASEPRGIVTQDVIRLRPDRTTATPEFLVYMLNSDLGRIMVDLVSVISTRTRVGLGDYKALKFPLPPLEEQTMIVSHLDRQTARIDTLVVEAGDAIKLLQERRSALISAAVTGKIDVRGVIADMTEAAA